MTGFLGNAYLWVKAAHIIFVIFWMAGMFILPRYLVHHQDALTGPAPNPAEADAWVEREAKLRRMILTPALIVTWVLGMMLAMNLGLLDGGEGLGWLHGKILLVVLLTGYHGWAVGYARKLAAGTPTLPTRTLRMVNEVPALFVTVIVVLVVVRPF